MTKTVALQKCNEYLFDDVYSCIRRMMELLPPPDVKGKVVLLKPNILYPKKKDHLLMIYYNHVTDDNLHLRDSYGNNQTYGRAWQSDAAVRPVSQVHIDGQRRVS